jgi:hypothetical protein
MQEKWRAQSLFNQIRLEKLLAYWEEEQNKFFFDLHDSKTKEDQKLLKLMTKNTVNKKLANKLLSLFIDKCRFHHALAFIQSRSTLPDSDLEELKEIFNTRKAYIKKVLLKVTELTEKGFIKSKLPMRTW